MRVRFVTIGAAGVLAMVGAASLPAAQAAPTQYYLHAQGGCGNSAPEKYYFDQHKPTAKDDDGCGEIGTGPLVGSSFEFSYPGKGLAPATFAKGTVIKGVIYITTEEPDQVPYTIDVQAGKAKAVLGQATGTANSSGDIEGTGIPSGTYTQVPFSFTANRAFTTTDPVVLNVSLSNPDVFVGYGGDHISRFAIG
jgi:hypothetical protein